MSLLLITVYSMTHMRRDFRDAVKDNRKGAEHAMAEIQKLYRIAGVWEFEVKIFCK